MPNPPPLKYSKGFNLPTQVLNAIGSGQYGDIQLNNDGTHISLTDLNALNASGKDVILARPGVGRYLTTTTPTTPTSATSGILNAIVPKAGAKSSGSSYLVIGTVAAVAVLAAFILMQRK